MTLFSDISKSPGAVAILPGRVRFRGEADALPSCQAGHLNLRIGNQMQTCGLCHAKVAKLVESHIIQRQLPRR